MSEYYYAWRETVNSSNQLMLAITAVVLIQIASYCLAPRLVSGRLLYAARLIILSVSIGIDLAVSLLAAAA